MSSNAHANTLLAALSEVEKSPSLGFAQSFTFFTQQPSSSPAVSNTSTTASSSTDEDIEVISSNSSEASKSSVQSTHHRMPQAYNRKDSKAIPKKTVSPNNLSSPGLSRNTWNGAQTQKNEVKLGIVKAAGDSHTPTILEKAGWCLPAMNISHQNGGRGRGRGSGRGRGGGDHDNRGRGRGLKGNATGLNMAGRQLQTTPNTADQAPQVNSKSRNWRFADRLTCSTSGTQVPGISMLNVPHTTAGPSNSTSNVAPNPSRGNLASNCPTTSNSDNRCNVSSTQPTVTLASFQQPPRTEVETSNNMKEGNVNSTAAASIEKEESSQSNDSDDASSSPKELLEALCPNCGAWSVNDRFCSFCRSDFRTYKPKKTRPRTVELFPTARKTYRKQDGKGNKKTVSPNEDSVSKTNAASVTPSQCTNAMSNLGNAQDGNAKSKLVSVKSLASGTGTNVKPKERFIVMKSVLPDRKEPTPEAKTSIDKKKFYTDRIKAVTPSPIATSSGVKMAIIKLPVTSASSAGGSTKMAAMTSTVTSSTLPNARWMTKGDEMNSEGKGAQRGRKRSGGKRKTPAKRAPPKRKEPEIVVLISDSEDEEEEKQKSTPAPATEDAATDSDEELARSFMTVKAKMRDEKGNLLGRLDTPSGKDSPDGPQSLQQDRNCLLVAFNVAILRFGSWPMHVTGKTFKLPAVSMTPEGFHFHFQQSSHKCGKIDLLLKDVEKCDHYINDNGYSVFFLTTTPSFANLVRSWLGMNRKEAHFDPGSKEEYEKMVVIRSVDNKVHSYKEQVQKVLAAMAEKSNISGSGLKFEPIDCSRARALLENSTRPELKGTILITRQNNGSQAPTINFTDKSASLTMQKLSKLSSGQAGGTKTKNSSDDLPDNKLFVYPPPPKFGGITVTTEDRDCLEDGEFLNDVIIDFYLKYIIMEKLSEGDQERTHLFSCFFYKRLLQQDKSRSLSPDLNGLTPKEKRHQKVRKWTRHVDIFAKDFIIIPINDCAHWFVAVICFAGEVIHMKKGAGKSSSQSPSPSLSNQPSPAAASSSATPSPAPSSRATPSPSEQLANHGTPGVQSTQPSEQLANHRTPGVQVSSSSQQPTNPNQGAEPPSKSPSGQNIQSPHGNSESANGMAEAGHVGQQPAIQRSNSANEEEPMDTSESPDDRIEDKESERTQELKNPENNPPNSPLNKSLGNSTEVPSASTDTSTPRKVNSESAISSSQASPRSQSSPASVKSPAVNGAGTPKKKPLDHEYQQYHAGRQKQFKQPCILVFDSLAGAPRRNVIAKLRDYLTIEWETRKEGKCEFTTANMKGMNPKVPQQTNFSDCGLYVCQYVQTFFEKPIMNYHSPMRGLVSWFPEEVVAKKRQEIRTAIKELHEAYKSRR